MRAGPFTIVHLGSSQWPPSCVIAPEMDPLSRTINSESAIDPKDSTNSRTLLFSSSASSNTSRKGRFEAGAIDQTIGRASMSMPPPSKLAASYKTSSRPSSVLTASEYGTEGDEGSSSVDKSVELTDDLEKTPNIGGGEGRSASVSYGPLTLPDAALRPPKAASADGESNRMSFSSLFSMGSAVHGGAAGPSAPQSTASSNAGSVKGYVPDQNNTTTGPLSPSLGPGKGDASSAPTTATDPVSVTTTSHRQQPGLMSPPRQHSQQNLTVAAKHLESWSTSPLPRSDNRSRSRTQRRPSGSTAASSASPNNADRGKNEFYGLVLLAQYTLTFLV